MGPTVIFTVLLSGDCRGSYGVRMCAEAASSWDAATLPSTFPASSPPRPADAGRPGTPRSSPQSLPLPLPAQDAVEIGCAVARPSVIEPGRSIHSLEGNELQVLCACAPHGYEPTDVGRPTHQVTALTYKLQRPGQSPRTFGTGRPCDLGRELLESAYVRVRTRASTPGAWLIRMRCLVISAYLQPYFARARCHPATQGRALLI